jgi:hypothetical protein
MILYTDMPPELVLNGMNSHSPVYAELNVDGVLVQVEMIAPHQAKIVRLISPDPRHYLNPAFAPGRTIEFRPFVTG